MLLMSVSWVYPRAQHAYFSCRPRLGENLQSCPFPSVVPMPRGGLYWARKGSTEGTFLKPATIPTACSQKSFDPPSHDLKLCRPHEGRRIVRKLQATIACKYRVQPAYQPFMRYLAIAEP